MHIFLENMLNNIGQSITQCQSSVEVKLPLINTLLGTSNNNQTKICEIRCQICQICQLSKAIFSTFYNISQPNFAIVLILVYS